MTTRYKTKAFVFKKEERGESDRVFSVFTDDFGRLDIFAKAIRKNNSKLRGGIDTFFLSEIEFVQGKNKKTLTDTLVMEKFKNVSQDFRKFIIARGISEVLENFIKGEEKDKELFDLLAESFCKLNDHNLKAEKCGILYYYFLWNALFLFGYKPEVHKCNVCQSRLEPRGIYFSNKLGGIICKNCLPHDAQARIINSDAVKILRLIFKKEWATLSRLKIEPPSRKIFKEVSNNYYSYVL